LEFAELTDETAEAFCNHRGNLVLDSEMILSLDSSVSEILARKKGTINGVDPAEWVASLES
jgi:hypothetical protein